MAVTVDAVAGDATGSTAPSLNWTHTVGVGATLAIVAIGFNDGGRSVTACTFGGVAMTQVPSSIGRSGTGNTDRHVELWYLINPASGSRTVSVSIDGSSPSIAGESTTYFGSHATTPLGTAAASGGTGTSRSATVTGVANGLMATACAARASAPTPPSGSTNTNQQLAGTNMFGAIATKSGTGSTTLTWTQSSSDVIAVTAVPILPAVTTLNRLRLGDALINAIRVGDSTVSKVYVGDTQVWP